MRRNFEFQGENKFHRVRETLIKLTRTTIKYKTAGINLFTDSALNNYFKNAGGIIIIFGFIKKTERFIGSLQAPVYYVQRTV